MTGFQEISCLQLCDESINIDGDRDRIWSLLVDWRRMPEWDIFMKSLHFEGPLALGSTGTIHMRAGGSSKLTVTAWQPPHNYSDEMSIAFTKLTFHHHLTELAPGQFQVRFVVEGSGLLTTLMGKMMQQDMELKMPILLNNFKELYKTLA